MTSVMMSSQSQNCIPSQVRTSCTSSPYGSQHFGKQLTSVPVQEPSVAPHYPWITIKTLYCAHRSLEALTPACPACLPHGTAPMPTRLQPPAPYPVPHARPAFPLQGRWKYCSLHPSLPSSFYSQVLSVGRPPLVTPFSVAGYCLSPSENASWILTTGLFTCLLSVICYLLSRICLELSRQPLAPGLWYNGLGHGGLSVHIC